MQFSIVSTPDALAALEDRWNRLVEAAPDGSVFQTFAWQTIWWRLFGGGRRLRVILVEQAGRPVGILPLYVERTGLLPAIGLRRLRLIGYGGDTAPDDLGPIVAGAEPAAVIDAMIDALNAIRNEWDIADFEDLDPRSPLIAALERRAADIQLSEGARISYVELPDSFEGYLAKLSANRRWKLRRGRKKLHEHAPYRFHVVASRAELDAHYPDLVRLHHDRWEHRSEHFGFSTDAYVDFHRQAMAAMLDRDCLRLMLLIDAGGEVMAANYCYRWRSGFYFFQGGFAKQYEPYRIGEVLMGHAIEQAIEEGMAVFDMLRGEHDYKKSLTDRIRTRTHVRLYQPTLRTLSYRTLRASYRQMRRLYGQKAADGAVHEHAA